MLPHPDDFARAYGCTKKRARSTKQKHPSLYRAMHTVGSIRLYCKGGVWMLDGKQAGPTEIMEAAKAMLAKRVAEN